MNGTVNRKFDLGNSLSVGGNDIVKDCSPVVAYDENVAQSQSNLALDLAFSKTGLKLLIIEASAAITLEINNATTPDKTLVLAAGQHIMWTEDDGTLCGSALLTAIIGANDVTNIYATTGAIGADGCDLIIFAGN